MEPKWLTVARGELGTREIQGPQSNPRIVDYAKVAFGKGAPDSEAWCARFVGFCLVTAGLPGSGKANARSYLDYGEEVTGDPPVGAITVFWRGSKTGWQGHVAFFLRREGDKIYVLGGNQGKNEEVCISAEPASRLLGYRWPAEVLIPVKAPANGDLKAVQERLIALGYHEVGRTDGQMGTLTRGALLAFKGDWNEQHPDQPLTLDATYGDDVVLALAKADPRPISPERMTAPESTIGDYKAVKNSKIVSAVGKVAVAVGAGGIVDGNTDLLTKAEAANSFWGRAKAAIGPIWAEVEPLWPVVLIVAAVAVIFWVRQTRKEEILSHRMGQTFGDAE